MDPQTQPQSRRGRRSQAEEQPQPECALPTQPECPLPTPKKDDLPPGTRRKALPDGGFMIIKDNFPNGRSDS